MAAATAAAEGVAAGIAELLFEMAASAALVLAGLVADDVTEVHRVYHIDRGYERIEDRLSAMGAVIRRESDPWAG